MQWVFPNAALLVHRRLWFGLFLPPLPLYSHEAKVGALNA